MNTRYANQVLMVESDATFADVKYAYRKLTYFDNVRTTYGAFN